MSGILSYHNDWVAAPQGGAVDLNGSPENVYAGLSTLWQTPGNQKGPTTIHQMFDFARFLWKHDPTFQQAVRRVIGYFLTDLEFYDPTHKAELKDEDINSYRQVLEERLNIKFALNQLLQTYFLYDNVIISLLPPIERRVQCPNCGMIHPLSVVVAEENSEFRFKYHAKGVRFEITCQRCNNRGDWNAFDVLADYRRNVCLTLYNPYHFQIECDQFSDKRLYTWNIPSDLRTAVKDGKGKTHNSTP
jgi:hypothetical protein